MPSIRVNGKDYGMSTGLNIVDITEAEWNALPESKNSDGILYRISDGEDFSAKNLVCTDVDGKVSNVQDILNEQNNKIIDVGENLAPKVLWTNTAPNASFSAKTLTILELDSASVICVTFKCADADKGYIFTQTFPTELLKINSELRLSTAFGNSYVERDIKFDFNNKQVIFGGGLLGGQSNYDNRAIPLSIIAWL